MTHDELLAEIDIQLLHLPSYFKAGDKTIAGMKALRAVVELHKPRVNLDFPYQPVCQQCANIIDPWDENSYPCPTIQAIYKELN